MLRIDALAENPTAGARLKGELTGLWRVREGGEGEYRIIYELRHTELIVLVLQVAVQQLMIVNSVLGEQLGNYLTLL